MANNLWETTFRDFLLSETGRQMIVEAYHHVDDQNPASSNDRTIFSVFFNLLNIADSCAIVLDSLKTVPGPTIERCHQILTEVGRKVMQEMNIKIRSNVAFRFRIKSLVALNDDAAILSTVPKDGDVGKLVEFCGTVVKASQPRMIEKFKRFLCATCHTEFRVMADVSQNNLCPTPTRCANRESCEGVNIRELPSKPIHDSKDYQEIKVQEKVGKSVIGKIPRSVWVILDEDQMDTCKAGDDVVVVGEVARRWSPLGSGIAGRTDLEYVLVANSVQVNNFQKSFRLLSNELIQEIQDFWRQHQYSELEGRLKIMESFCPQVYGLYAVKLAVSVVLCGGLERVDQTGTKIRGEPHMLLIGDPGTGKSQILRYASKLVSRSVMTTGIGSTSAGLTASATRDGGQWHLEAGALVMADGGLCCIDEFNSIKEVDRVAIHEAMEQQSISVAKAGLVCQLRTRCTILASTNPKGKYDPEEPLSVNVGIASPLLSRFDLVYLLLDSKNSSWDKKVSTYILQGKDPMKEMMKGSSASESLWSFTKMQSYFCYCKQFSPKIGSAASRILSKYYQRRRVSVAADNQNMARSTVRLLQSAIRLAEAHARLMCREEVTVLDAVTVVLLLDTSMDSNGSLVASTNPLHTTFPANPTKEYLREAEAVLTGLGLQDIWQQERRRVIEGRGKRPEPKPTPQNSVPKLAIRDTIANPTVRDSITHPTIEDSPSEPIQQDICTKLVSDNQVLSSENSGTRNLSGITKIREIHDQDSGMCPESTVSRISASNAGTKRKFIFSDDKDLEDLDDDFDDLDEVIPSKKCRVVKNFSLSVAPEVSEMSSSENKVVSDQNDEDQLSDQKLNRTVDDMSIFDIDPSQFDETEMKNESFDTFSITQDIPVTSTQIEISTKPKIRSSNDSGSKTTSKMDSSISPVSIKTLSKLRAFAAPPKEENVKASKTSLTDEGNGTSIVDKETFHIERASKISIDEGNGSSIVDSKLLKDSPKEDIVKRSNVVDNSKDVFPSKKTTKTLDIERQRSLLASVFSDPFEDNLDDLDF